MRNKRHIKMLAVVAAVCALVLALSGCSSDLNSPDTDSPAAQNRQYMSQLNQQMSSLQDSMNQFQEALGQQDTVTMRARAQDVSKIVQDVNNTDAPDMLNDVKGEYADGLSTLDQALNSYVDLYTQQQNGQITQDDFNTQLQSIQDTYNQGVDKLNTADQDVQTIAQQ